MNLVFLECALSIMRTYMTLRYVVVTITRLYFAMLGVQNACTSGSIGFKFRCTTVKFHFNSNNALVPWGKVNCRRSATGGSWSRD